jgi:CBS domain-containing protein
MARTSFIDAAGLTVADVTHPESKALPATATVGEVRAWFEASGSRQMALLADRGRYVGRVLRGELDGADASGAAAELAQRGPTVMPDEPASRGEELALASAARRVPVVDRDGRLLGIVAVTVDLQAFCMTGDAERAG